MPFLSLHDAIEAHVADGASVALEGFTHLIPFAAGHELVRQNRRDLHLIRMTPDLVYDQLIGMGCARKLTFSWGGNPGVGSLHRLRDAVEHEWPRPDEGKKRQPAGNQQAEQRNDEVGDFENSVPFGDDVAPVPVRRDLIGPDRKRRHDNRDAEPPPGFVPARV